jgi:hypothetical protein
VTWPMTLPPHESSHSFGMAVTHVEVGGVTFPFLGRGDLLFTQTSEELSFVSADRCELTLPSARTVFVLDADPLTEYEDLHALCVSLPTVAMTVSGFSADKGKPCLLTLFPHRCETSGRRLTLRAEAVNRERQLFSLRVEA